MTHHYVGTGCRITDLNSGNVIFESNGSSGAHEAVKAFLGSSQWHVTELDMVTFVCRNSEGKRILWEDYVEIVTPSANFHYQN